MNTELGFDYYYGAESEQFSFFRIPRLLFKDERFKTLSCEAKLLYGLMLDRLSLSRNNGWFDEQGRVYINYLLEHICIDMGFGKDKAVKILKELDVKTGIGLIERKNQGQGRANIIYVKNFASISCPEEDCFTQYESFPQSDSFPLDDSSPQNGISRSQDFGKTEVRADFGNSEVKTSANPNPRVRKNRSQDFGKTDTSYINQNKTYPSKTDPIHPSYETEHYALGPKEPKLNQTDQRDRMDLIAQIGLTDPMKSPVTSRNRFIPTMAPSYFSDRSTSSETTEYSQTESPYRRLIRRNINYDRHICDDPNKGLYKAFYELICEIVESKDTRPIYINKQPIKAEVVRSRLLKITEEHMEYVAECLKENKNGEGIRNLRAYMLTMLYNAPVTFEAYITQKVNHDMYGGGWGEKGIIGRITPENQSESETGITIKRQNGSETEETG